MHFRKFRETFPYVQVNVKCKTATETCHVLPNRSFHFEETKNEAFAVNGIP